MINCTFEDGGKGSLRHVVVHVIAVLNNKILLVKRAPHLTNPNKYGFPGGFIDRDETIPEGAERELSEETGYQTKSIKFLGFIDKPDRKGEDRQNVAFNYLIEVGDKISEPDNESTEIKWFNLDNLPAEEDFAFDHYEVLKSYLQTI